MLVGPLWKIKLIEIYKILGPLNSPWKHGLETLYLTQIELKKRSIWPLEAQIEGLVLDT